VGIIKFFKIALKDINVRTFLFFAIVLGAAVGLTSYNFGALSRYKIPCLPFFTASLAIIYYYGTLKKERYRVESDLMLRKKAKESEPYL
jgi:hypothetical protein